MKKEEKLLNERNADFCVIGNGIDPIQIHWNAYILWHKILENFGWRVRPNAIPWNLFGALPFNTFRSPSTDRTWIQNAQNYFDFRELFVAMREWTHHRALKHKILWWLDDYSFHFSEPTKNSERERTTADSAPTRPRRKTLILRGEIVSIKLLELPPLHRRTPALQPQPAIQINNDFACNQKRLQIKRCACDLLQPRFGRA